VNDQQAVARNQGQDARIVLVQKRSHAQPKPRSGPDAVLVRTRSENAGIPSINGQLGRIRVAARKDLLNMESSHE
jgi:hypothetical protein